eukprot:TRINITY_DN951_c0_g1_i1.p1 TRINITY_DN951_c0_g1~~TRINITY_DN951_c0_g1_i1.p1  ORF type:complete len:388 (-),score=164.05 TRINITY_DN951_c0_g1_i1:288-1451(-)
MVLHGDKDVFDSYRKSKKAHNAKVDVKLTSYQKKAMAFNRALLALHMGKKDQCRDLVATLAQQFPDSELPELISAALLFRDKKVDKCIQVLENYVENNQGKQSVRVLLTLAQVHYQSGNQEEAVKVLHQIDGLRHTPAMTATLVHILTELKQVEDAVQVLNQAMEYWTNAATQDSGKQAILRSLLEFGGNFLLKHQQYESAAEAFETLYAMDRSNVQVLCHLVIACSFFDSDKAERFAEYMPTPEMESEMDVDALEKIAPKRITKRFEDSEAASKVGELKPAEQSTQRKKRKKRKRPVPKDFVEGKTPDPERWKPKYERSYYRKTRKGKKNQFRGSQGSSSVSDTGGNNSSSTSKLVEENNNTPKKNNNNNNNSNKKKKKKGKKGKW